MRLLPFLLLAAAPVAAQQVPVRTLAAPEAELEESFDQVTAVRELSDGRVVVADRSAKRVALADFRKGAVTTIGREGSGPNEYVMPAGAIALPGDTTLVPDPQQQRFFVVKPDGTPGGTIPWPGFGPLGSVRGADRQGRIYATGPRLALGPGGDAALRSGDLPDTVPVIRWTRAPSRVDTVGWVQGPKTNVNVSGGPNERRVMVRSQPISPQDDWHVAADGRLAVARVSDYHVEWWNGAERTRGPAVKYAPVPVTQADKDRVMAAMRNPRNRIVVTQGGPARTPPPGPPPIPDSDWPATKPPFAAGGVEANGLVSPAGEFWVRRSVAAGAAPVYDVFDGAGRQVRQVVLPKDTRVVGFGARHVYVARTDADELQWLGRYAL